MASHSGGRGGGTEPWPLPASGMAEPMLLPVLSAHMKRCLDLLRESGLRSDSQISKRMLRKIILQLGLQVRSTVTR